MKLVLIIGVFFTFVFANEAFGTCASDCAPLPPALEAQCLASCPTGATGGTGGVGTGAIPGIPGTGSGGIPGFGGALPPLSIDVPPELVTIGNDANANWNNSNTNWSDSNDLWSQVLTGKNPDGSANSVTKGLEAVGDANANWAMTNSILDRVARPEFAFLMSAATTVGAFVGTAAVEGVSSLLINGASWIYSTLHELITNEKEKAKLLEGYQKAEQFYQQLSESRANLFQALNRSLLDLRASEELREMGFQADLRTRLGEVKEQGARARRVVQEGRDDIIIDLRVDLERTRAHMRDPLALTRDCHRQLMTQAERLSASISERESANNSQVEEYEKLAGTMQEVIDRIGPEANPKIYLCNQLHDQINNLFRIETEMQRARASLIAGHFVMLSHQDELSSEARELFSDGLRFSDTDGLQDYITDVLSDSENERERNDVRRAHVAAVNSHQRTERLFASMRDGSIPMNPNLELRGSRLSRGSNIRTIRQEQLCAVNALECENLGVRDYRTEGIRYYGELNTTCGDTVEGMRDDYNDVMDGLSFTELVASSVTDGQSFNLSEDRRNEIELPLQVEQAIREVTSAKRALRSARGPEAKATAQRAVEAAEANEVFAKLRLAQFETKQVAERARRSQADVSGNAGHDGLSLGDTARYYEEKSEELVLRANALERIDGQIAYHTSAIARATTSLETAERNLAEARRVADETRNPVDQRRALLAADVVAEARTSVESNQRLLEEMRGHKAELDANPDLIARFRRQALVAERRALEFNINSNERLAEFFRANGDHRTARRHETQVARYRMQIEGFDDRHASDLR